MTLELDLLVPGLLGAWPASQAGYVCDGLDAPMLRWLLSRGRGDAVRMPALDEPGLAGVSFQMFGQQRPAGDWPAAAVSYLADTATAPAAQGDAVLLRIDPVHLRADAHGAHLLHGAGLGLDLDEARALAAALAPTLPAPGGLPAAIEVPTALRWYLRVERAAAPTGTAPSAVQGARSGNGLPGGPRGRAWRAWLTEAQMLLHASAVNLRREGRGAPPVNSLWLWGAGSLPPAAAPRFDAVYADDPVARGLALLQGLAPRPAPADLPALLASGADGRVLALLCACHGLARAGAVEQWRGALQRFEADWAVPAVAALRAGRLRALRVHAPPSAGRECRPGDRWRFWRIALPLPVVLQMYG